MPGRRADLRPKTGKGVPAAGNPAYSQTEKKSAAYRMGTSKRDGEVGIFKRGPGPTAYNHHENINNTRAKSSSYR